MKKCIKNFQDMAVSSSQQKAIKGGGDGDTTIDVTTTSDYIGTADTIDG